MFRIGDFARLGQVSVKTLHHYDEVGLLRPALVDEENGYRHYTADQLTTLHRILTLKGLGFSLQEIADVLGDAPLTMPLADILRKKIAEAHQTISREETRIAQVEAWLGNSEENIMPKYDALLKTLEPQLVASIREHMKDIWNMGALFGEAAEYIKSQGAKESGPGMVLYHDTEEGLDAEIAFPISTPISGTERVRVYELPRVENAACLVYKGTHAAMGEASHTIAKWIEDNGYRISGPNRVLFLDCEADESNPDVAVVETQFPVEKA
jgi:DNA-binding transcriptional MerR regulator